jgi:uncharacterized protein with HEPN domain
MRDDRERILDILEAVSRIEEYTDKGKGAFLEDPLVQVWVIHHLEIMGEAVKGLSCDFLDHHPSVPWADLIGMRNVLVHRYFGIDKELVWKVVEKDLPSLKRYLNSLKGE